jgi:hypothetical protein
MKTKTKSTAVAAATAAPVAPAAGLKRINLAGISTKAPAAKAAKTYPLLPDSDGQVAALVNGIVEKAEQLEAIEGALEIEKAELIAIAKPFYFAHHAGQMAVAKGCRGRRRRWSPGSPERMEGRPPCRPIFVRRRRAAVGRMGRAARGNPRRRRSAALRGFVTGGTPVPPSKSPKIN